MKATFAIAVGIAAVFVGIGGAYWPTGASSQAEDRGVIISVPGIPGPYCAYGAEKRLMELAGAKRVDVLWEQEILRAYFDDGTAITREQIAEAMTKADYPYEYTIEMP